MRYRRLGSTNLDVSAIGFGAAPLGGEYGFLDEESVLRTVAEAIDGGINFFDTAPYYGRTVSEERLGRALDGRRQNVCLATKCGRYGLREFDYRPERVRQSLDDSLRRLRTDYLDLFQLHDTEFVTRDEVLLALTALVEAKESGKVRFIGITGLSLRMLRSIAEAFPVDTILSYCHYDLLADDLDQVLTPFAEAEGIGLINASPLHMGVLTEAGPPAWHPASSEVLEAGRRVVRLCRDRGLETPAVALRFCVSHPSVATTLVGMSTPEEVRANLRALDEAEDEGLWAAIRGTVGEAHNAGWFEGLPENA